MSTISYLGMGPSLAGMQIMLLFIVYLVRIHKMKYSHNGMKGLYEMMINYYFLIQKYFDKLMKKTIKQE